MPSFDHDRPTDDSEWEYRYTETNGDTDVIVLVSKVGGGTVGESYAGFWHYEVTANGVVLEQGSDLETGTAKTHEETAFVMLAMIEHEVTEIY